MAKNPKTVKHEKKRGIEARLLEHLDEFVGFARRRLRDPELAADAVQESLLKALKASDQLVEEDKTKAWFYRILRRTMIDLCRRHGSHDRALAGLEHELRSSVTAEEERDVCACLERLLPAMAPQYADLIKRVDLNEESPTAVAESLGISRNSLNVRRYRARQQLKKRLVETCRICADHGCLDCHCAPKGKDEPV